MGGVVAYLLALLVRWCSTCLRLSVWKACGAQTVMPRGEQSVDTSGVGRSSSVYSP